MFNYIDTDAALENFLQEIQIAKWIILDTEFIREKTYFPKLCLIQVATEHELACIDPLPITNLQPFFDFLQREDVVKVLHAAFQDMEIIHHLSGKTVSPVFDTQIAAAVLGLGDQLGYARLVEELLGVQLDKSQSRTDWSRRPLNQGQLNYAIDDVRYLRAVYPLLLQQLEDTGRSAWLNKSFRHLTDSKQYQPNPEASWERVKMVQILKSRQLSVLRELAAWRERLAIEKDLPRRWLVSDELLIDMARLVPKKLKDFEQLRGLNQEQIQRYGATWLSLIETGYNKPPEEWPELRRRRKLDANAALLVDLLMLVISQQALAHNISPQMLATRSQIEKMLVEGRDTLSDDWRGSLVNDLLASVLAGEVCVSVYQQTVTISPCTSAASAD